MEKEKISAKKDRIGLGVQQILSIQKTLGSVPSMCVHMYTHTYTHTAK